MSTPSRVEYVEILRRERDQVLLTLAATRAVLEQRSARGQTCAARATELTWRERDFIAEQEGETLAIDTALRELSPVPFDQ
jgi:hypothetical protein